MNKTPAEQAEQERREQEEHNAFIRRSWGAWGDRTWVMENMVLKRPCPVCGTPRNPFLDDCSVVSMLEPSQECHYWPCGCSRCTNTQTGVVLWSKHGATAPTQQINEGADQ